MESTGRETPPDLMTYSGGLDWFPKAHPFTERGPGRHRRDCTETDGEGDAERPSRFPRGSTRFQLPVCDSETEQAPIACAGTVRPRQPRYPHHRWQAPLGQRPNRHPTSNQRTGLGLPVPRGREPSFQGTHAASPWNIARLQSRCSRRDVAASSSLSDMVRYPFHAVHAQGVLRLRSKAAGRE